MAAGIKKIEAPLKLRLTKNHIFEAEGCSIPGVGKAVLQIPSSFIKSVCHTFVLNLQDTVYPKL